MAISFRILPEHGLVYVRYDGLIMVAETFASVADYAAHPEYRPGQKQLIDMSHVTGIEKNYLEIFKLQAIKAGLFMGRSEQVLLVYYTPTEVAQTMAGLILRSWEGQQGVVAVVQDNEAEALAILGLRERRLVDLLQGTS